MTFVTRLGPLLLALAVACGPRSVSEEPEDITVVVPMPARAVVTQVAPTPEPATRRPERRRRRARLVAPTLPAPRGLHVDRDASPMITVGAVDWTGAPEVAVEDAPLLAAHLERIDAQEATLADLAHTRYELNRSLDAIHDVLPVLDRHTRLRAGLQACVLRRELEELEQMQRALHGDVLAFRELIAPAVRVARSQ